MRTSILSIRERKAIDDYIIDWKLSRVHASLRDLIPEAYKQLVDDLLAIETLISRDSLLAEKMKDMGTLIGGLRKFYGLGVVVG